MRQWQDARPALGARPRDRRARPGAMAIGFCVALSSASVRASSTTGAIPKTLAAAGTLNAAIDAASAPAPAARSDPARGLAVVAVAGATDVAWPLAQSIYMDRLLRPDSLDDRHARVLCGERPLGSAPSDLLDLHQMVAALGDDDAATRVLLGELAHRLSVRAIVVVRVGEKGRTIAKVFLSETASFDAPEYSPDEGQTPDWSAVVRSLERSFGTLAVKLQAPALATREAPLREERHPKQFYESGWFWGALGAAALAGGAFYFVSRDSSAPTIHLELQVH